MGKGVEARILLRQDGGRRRRDDWRWGRRGRRRWFGEGGPGILVHRRDRDRGSGNSDCGSSSGSGGDWNQLCRQLAQRTVRPSSPIALSGTR